MDASVDAFLQMIEAIEDPHGVYDVLRTIGYIHKGRMEAAVKFAIGERKKGKHGGFGFGDKSFYDLVVEKCSDGMDLDELDGPDEQDGGDATGEGGWQATTAPVQVSQIVPPQYEHVSSAKVQVLATDEDDDDYFKDFAFTIGDVAFDSLGACAMTCLLASSFEPAGFEIAFNPTVSGVDANTTDMSLSPLTFRSVGENSDRFVALLYSAFDIEVPQGCQMAPSVSVSALLLSGDLTGLKDEPVKFKLFYDSSDEAYFELFLWVDIANSKVVWSEKDPDYRDDIAAVFSGVLN